MNRHSSDFGDICTLYSPFLHQLTMQYSLFEPGRLWPCPRYSRRGDRINLVLLRDFYKGEGAGYRGSGGKGKLHRAQGTAKTNANRCRWGRGLRQRPREATAIECSAANSANCHTCHPRVHYFPVPFTSASKVFQPRTCCGLLCSISCLQIDLVLLSCPRSSSIPMRRQGSLRPWGEVRSFGRALKPPVASASVFHLLGDRVALQCRVGKASVNCTHAHFVGKRSRAKPQRARRT